MKKAPLYFRQLSVLSDEGATVLGVLELGLEAEVCKRVGIHTSAAGMSILLNGRKLCSGKTAHACIAKFKELQAEAKKR